jgi:GxxExxY protein
MSGKRTRSDLFSEIEGFAHAFNRPAWPVACTLPGMVRVNDPAAESVIGAAIKVHSALGPGLLESAYQQCLMHELRCRQVSFVADKPVPVVYDGVRLDCGYRLDLFVDDRLIIELKAVEQVLPVHHAQVLTYLKLLRVQRALLINFNVPRLVDGIKAFIV